MRCTVSDVLRSGDQGEIAIRNTKCEGNPFGIHILKCVFREVPSLDVLPSTAACWGEFLATGVTNLCRIGVLHTSHYRSRT